jgi:hypothetical protein
VFAIQKLQKATDGETRYDSHMSKCTHTQFPITCHFSHLAAIMRPIPRMGNRARNGADAICLLPERVSYFNDAISSALRRLNCTIHACNMRRSPPSPHPASSECLVLNSRFHPCSRPGALKSRTNRAVSQKVYDFKLSQTRVAPAGIRFCSRKCLIKSHFISLSQQTFSRDAYNKT